MKNGFDEDKALDSLLGAWLLSHQSLQLITSYSDMGMIMDQEYTIF